MSPDPLNPLVPWAPTLRPLGLSACARTSVRLSASVARIARGARRVACGSHGTSKRRHDMHELEHAAISALFTVTTSLPVETVETHPLVGAGMAKRAQQV